MFEPLTHSHVPAVGLNFHRSLKYPDPPNIHRLPNESLQDVAELRAPGVLPVEATPCVPYTPGAPLVFAPLTHSQVPVVGLSFHRSFKSPLTPSESNPFPPNSHRLPDESVQETADARAPGVLPAEATPKVP